MKPNIPFCIFIFILVTGAFNGSAQQIKKKQYIPTRINQPPVIDGLLDDLVWEQGNWESDFIQFEPRNSREPSQQTEFCILFDDTYLYVGVRAFDHSPDSIITRLTRRDNDDGDAVGVAFDSYHDLRTAFIMGVTAGGTRFDIIMTDGSNEDPTWDPNWWARTTVNAEGWVAEMRIPLSQLRFKKNGNGIWGLQVFRKIHRHGEMDFWQPIPADAPGLVHLFGEMKGMADIVPRRIFDVTPYLVTYAEGYKAQPGNPFATGSGQDLKLGLDAKIGITNNFTLDLTLNPDFGQVEADPSEVNLSAFESYFQEKRPFFIEGRNISSFSVGIGDGGIGNDNLFYSRRIGRRPNGSIPVNGDAFVDRPDFTNILGAAKITGKTQDGLSVAVIQTITGEARAEVDYQGERTFHTLEPLSNYFVGRVQKDINQGNALLGGMFTSVHRRLDDNLAGQMHREAYSGGLDFTQYFKDKTWFFNVNAALSHVTGDEPALLRTQRSSARYFQRPDAKHLTLDPTRTSMTGTGGRMQLVKAAGHFNMMGALLWKSPQFEINDMGFMREADQLFPVIWVGYRQWEPKGIYRSYNLNFNTYAMWNFGGEQLFTGLNLNGFIRYRNYWSSNAGVEYTMGLLSNTLLRGGPSFKLPNRMSSWWGIGTDNRKKLVIGVNGNWGLGAEKDMRSFRLGPNFTYKAADNINFSFSPSFSERFDELQYVRQFIADGSPRYVFASIDQKTINFSFRVNYTITPDLTIQYWGQPFLASGTFFDYKYITNPRNAEYTKRFQAYSPQQISFVGGNYLIDENLDQTVDYQFGQPDFSRSEFLSNLVLRWEFNPGSALYLVWNQTRSGFENQGEISFPGDMDDIFAIKPHNIFLLKFSYRIGIQ